MRPTEILKSEHRVIEQVLACLERLTALAEMAKALDRSAARDILDFFEQFADKCHHGKEETHLFPLMEARGFDRNRGPTGVMLAEHDQGRKCVRGMEASIEEASLGHPEALRQFIGYAQGYVNLLRQHILKEDQRLFPMADQALTDDDQRALLDRFENVEHAGMGAGTHERYLELADELAGRLNVAAQVAVPAAAHVCCGHGHQ